MSQCRKKGLELALDCFILRRDGDASAAWSHWYDVAGISYKTRAGTLIIPDPSVRVQAVIDGQGITLNDSLVESELLQGKLDRLGPAELCNSGYHLAYQLVAVANPDVEVFMGCWSLLGVS